MYHFYFPSIDAVAKRKMDFLDETINTATSHESRFIHPWVSMSLAIVFELIGTINTKASFGVTKPGPSITMFISYMFCALFLALALDVSVVASLDLGVAYATWSGIGTIAAALAGIYLYGEALSMIQWLGIVLTLVGVTLINVAPEFPRDHSMAVVDAGNIIESSKYGSMETTPAKMV